MHCSGEWTNGKVSGYSGKRETTNISRILIMCTMACAIAYSDFTVERARVTTRRQRRTRCKVDRGNMVKGEERKEGEVEEDVVCWENRCDRFGAQWKVTWSDD